MDTSMEFTLGLSEGVAWPWPIAVYLFFVGDFGWRVNYCACTTFL